MKKRTVKNTLLIIVMIACVYFGFRVIPELINAVARPYNLKTYRERHKKKDTIPPVSYYFSSTGNDSNDGRTKATARRNIALINDTEFNPGDSILLEGDQTFKGNIKLDEHDLGNTKKPIYIGSYGNGRAVIDAGEGNGIETLNSEGLHISRLVIKGNSADSNKGNGISVLNDLKGHIKLNTIIIDSVEVYGFGFEGINVEGQHGKSGFRDVTIMDCVVRDNGNSGLYVKGHYNHKRSDYSHQHVIIRNVQAFNNLGRPKNKMNTGSGIVLSDTDDGLIEKCVAYNNGGRCTSLQGGPVGIWAWDANNVVIQYNESYNNKTNCPFDGGGFDLDGGASNCVLQYNYSHDNEGSGYLIYQFGYARKHTNNIVRYNISRNDGRKNGYSGIDVCGGVENSWVYNNTIFISPAAKDTNSALDIRASPETGNFPDNIIIANNIFTGSGNVNLVNVVKEIPTVKLVNNNYYNVDAAPVFKWNGKKFASFESWCSNASNKELYTNGSASDPVWQVVADTGSAANGRMLYALQAGSPLIDKGLNIEQLYKIKNVTKDINGVVVPQLSGYDIGACEFKKL